MLVTDSTEMPVFWGNQAYSPDVLQTKYGINPYILESGNGVRSVEDISKYLHEGGLIGSEAEIIRQFAFFKQGEKYVQVDPIYFRDKKGLYIDPFGNLKYAKSLDPQDSLKLTPLEDLTKPRYRDFYGNLLPNPPEGDLTYFWVKEDGRKLLKRVSLLPGVNSSINLPPALSFKFAYIHPSSEGGNMLTENRHLSASMRDACEVHGNGFVGLLFNTVASVRVPRPYIMHKFPDGISSDKVDWSTYVDLEATTPRAYIIAKTDLFNLQ
jgi:hypothetical protein